METAKICLFLTFVFLINCIKSESNPNHTIVVTKDGMVRGVLQTTIFKKVDFYSFKGIPYAKPPIGELRFKSPEPGEPWAPKILDAFEHGPICTQFYSSDTFNASEDCLSLNVYKPADVELGEKLAAMVFIHGGAFAYGSGNSDIVGPDFLIDQRVILVSMNYRLGVFGFLSIGTSEYSGNMGLKDQKLALKWVHSNIEYFSGDNQRITVFGGSAGSASTHYQILSSESRKYFRNAILMSGTVNNFWTMYGKRDHLEQAYNIARELGNPAETVEELIDFLKTVPASQIMGYGAPNGFQLRTCQTEFGPIVESECLGYEVHGYTVSNPRIALYGFPLGADTLFEENALQPFINDLPSNIYEKSEIDTDVIFSYCSTEFISFYVQSAKEIYDLKELDSNFSLALPFRKFNSTLPIDLPFDSPEYQKIAPKIREYYFKDAAIDENTLQQYIDLLSDINFAYGIDKSAKQHASKTDAKSYYIRFDVDSKLNIAKMWNIGNFLAGAAHGDDIFYVFRLATDSIYTDILENKDDEQSKICLQTIENMTAMFANFAKYGEPTHQDYPVDGFIPIEKGRVNYLNVINDGLRPGVDPNYEANELWSHIEQQLNGTK